MESGCAHPASALDRGWRLDQGAMIELAESMVYKP